MDKTEALIESWNENVVLKPGEQLKKKWYPWEKAVNEDMLFHKAKLGQYSQAWMRREQDDQRRMRERNAGKKEPE